MESMSNSVAMTEKGMAVVVGRRGRGRGFRRGRRRERRWEEEVKRWVLGRFGLFLGR